MKTMILFFIANCGDGRWCGTQCHRTCTHNQFLKRVSSVSFFVVFFLCNISSTCIFHFIAGCSHSKMGWGLEILHSLLLLSTYPFYLTRGVLALNYILPFSIKERVYYEHKNATGKAFFMFARSRCFFSMGKNLVLLFLLLILS
eukprot:SAG11_NODE_1740_length_4338_cov_2.608634_9_plen_144_part_00